MPDTAPNPAPSRCPRHLKPRPLNLEVVGKWVTFGDLCREPFRLFFPVATLVGVVGILLWPLMLSGWMSDFPGTKHARLMIQGFFGGFVFGFMGMSFPRFLEVKPLAPWETLPWLGLFIASAVAHTVGMINWGDALFLSQILVGVVVLGRRFPARKDLPPPSFALVGCGVACGVAGVALGMINSRGEPSQTQELLARLLSYHAFIMLSMLGAGGFLLPRFLGLGVRRKMPTSPQVTPIWRQSALVAFVAGLAMIGTYCLEAVGWPRLAATLRTAIIVGYFWREMPLEKLRLSWKGVDAFLIFGLISLPLGVLLAGWWPGWRVALSHIELITGFGLITMGVATRVIFGHSGNRSKLERSNPWMATAGVMMVLAMLCRLSGDLVPSTMASHYMYGAVCWLVGIVIWGILVLPKVLKPDPE